MNLSTGNVNDATKAAQKRIEVALVPLGQIHGIHSAIVRLLNEAKLMDIPGVQPLQQTSFYIGQQLEATFTVVPRTGNNGYKCVKGTYSLNYLTGHSDLTTKLTCRIVEPANPEFVQKMHVDDYIAFNAPLIREGHTAKIFYKNVERLNTLTHAYEEGELRRLMERILGMDRRTFMC